MAELNHPDDELGGAGITVDLAEFLRVIAQSEAGDDSELLEEARLLLRSASELSSSISITEANILSALKALVKNSSFAGASILRDHIRGNVVSIADNPFAIIGKYPEAAYNVWIKKTGAQWYVFYDPVPESGNLR
jgi:hypothetical protein